MKYWLLFTFILPLIAAANGQTQPETTQPALRIVTTDHESIAPGPFKPNWESLSDHQTPDWFRDAKFGIWAHWGPQCQPEDGDWYGRQMYQEGSDDYRDHLARYGPDSQVGFKDIIRDWHAEHWDPQKLVALYKRAGAKYFFALADHHDNFDLWNSKYQPWNATRLGPKRDLIADWAAAARINGLPFGVSVHASHAWTWYEPAQGADQSGLLAGVPYDGNLTAADGKGLWWDGLDPQALYAQRHPLSRAVGATDWASHSLQWAWRGGASVPDQAYCQHYFDRTMDLINQAQPDLIYFDDTVLPLDGVSDAGLKLAAHFYNTNLKRSAGKSAGVLFGKNLNDTQKKAVTLDVERGAGDRIEPLPWQSCTCIGDWHYQRQRFEQHSYKSSTAVLQQLCDTVSKNGNLLLNIPIRGDGTIDEDEQAIVAQITHWMDINGQAIFGSRPWNKYGEGPIAENADASGSGGFSEGKNAGYTSQDIRFTTNGDTLYAISMARPAGAVTIQSLGLANSRRRVAAAELLGASEPLHWSQMPAGLRLDNLHPGLDAPAVIRIQFQPHE